MLLPLVGLLTFIEPVFKNPFWLKCAGLILLAIAVAWILHRLGKGSFKWPAFAWGISASYFALLLLILWSFSGGFSSVFLVLGTPEIGGLIASLIGLFHWIRNGNKNAGKAGESIGDNRSV
jgi:hypothetical protein